MGHHVLWLDVIALDNVLRQRDQGGYLRRFKRGKAFLIAVLLPAAVFQLNPNRGVINTGSAAPVAHPGMPGQIALRHQLPDPRLAVVLRWDRRDQIVGADVFIGQGGERAVEVVGGIVDHQHLDTRVGRLGLPSGIQLIGTFIHDAFF